MKTIMNERRTEVNKDGRKEGWKERRIEKGERKMIMRTDIMKACGLAASKKKVSIFTLQYDD